MSPITVHTTAPECGIRRVRRETRKQRDHSLWVVDGLHGDKQYLSFSDCTANVITALKERVFFHLVDGQFVAPTAPTAESVRNTLTAFAHLVRRRAFSSVPVAIRDYHEAYRGPRKEVYRRAGERLAREGMRRSFAYLGTFVKHEKILNNPRKRAVPRVIQPRKPEYNVAVGRYIRHLEHPLYGIIDEICGGPTVMKGYNVVDIGTHMADAWRQFANPVAIGLDASRFDQHVSVPMLQWEHSVYSLFYHGVERRKLMRLLALQLENIGFASCPDGTYKYTVHGCRASGDINTAMGNCLIMCALVYAYTRYAGVGKWRLLNNGDDCVVIVERSDLPKFAALPQWFMTMGFVMTVEKPVFTLEEVEFCQMHPVFDGVTWRMVRNVRVVVSKDVTFLQRFASEKHYSSYRYVLAQGGLALTGGLPIMQQFYQSIGHGACLFNMNHVDSRFLESGFMHLTRGLSAKTRAISDIARVSFWRAFGLTPTEQRDWEDRVAGLPHLDSHVVGAADRLLL